MQENLTADVADATTPAWLTALVPSPTLPPVPVTELRGRLAMILLRSSVRAVYAPALLIGALLVALESASADTTLELKNDGGDSANARAYLEQ